jgi:hypothetical protein
LIDNNKHVYGNYIEVDFSIIEFMRTLDINFEGFDNEKIKEAINKKERKEFCIIYDFLYFNKNKKSQQEKKEKIKSKSRY